MSFASQFGKIVQGAAKQILGQKVKYKPAAGGEVSSIRGIWSSPYLEYDDGVTRIAAREPTLDVRVADVVQHFEEGPKNGDIVEFDDGVLGTLKYKVFGKPEGDGQGMVKLRLKLFKS